MGVQTFRLEEQAGGEVHLVREVKKRLAIPCRPSMLLAIAVTSHLAALFEEPKN